MNELIKSLNFLKYLNFNIKVIFDIILGLLIDNLFIEIFDRGE